MQYPDGYPKTERHSRAIDALLKRVRGLDFDAKQRLAVMLDEEMDLPYLDVMEREYAKLFRQFAPEQATVLRSRFIQALTESREYMVAQVRNLLHQTVETDFATLPESAIPSPESSEQSAD